MPRSARRPLAFGAVLAFQFTASVLLSAPPQIPLVNPSNDPSSRFGAEVRTLPMNGNIVVTDPNLTVGGNVKAGAVYLFNGQTGALMTTLTGTAANEAVGGGGIGVLTNGNFVVFSNYGAVDAMHPGFSATFVNGLTGLNGTVSVANSLIQTVPGPDLTAIPCLTGQPALPAGSCRQILGNVITANPVSSPLASVGSHMLGLPPITNELFTFMALPNGNYLVLSPGSNAVTFGNGTSGVVGPISAANSLIGGVGDVLGASQSLLTPMSLLSGVTVYPSGNYSVRSQSTFSATLGSATTGSVGTIPTANTYPDAAHLTNGNFVAISGTNRILIDGNTLAPIATTTASASTGVFPLTNGNYVLIDSTFGGGIGAVTFVSGTSGLNGSVTAANSLVGSAPTDAIGSNGILALSTGDYVVRSPNFGGGIGAFTFASGTTGLTGVVSAGNSFVGAAATDHVSGGGGIPLRNGGFVVKSPGFGGGIGAITFGKAGTNQTGTISAANSLVGSAPADGLGGAVIIALAKGAYVVSTPGFSANSGAVTFGNNATGATGVLSSSNSLVASGPDSLGAGGIAVLTNGGYVVSTPDFSGGLGAATFGNGTTGVSGVLSASNSLVGAAAFDLIGDGNNHDETEVFGPSATVPLVTLTGTRVFNSGGIVPLTNGGYVVLSPFFNGKRGAATFGNGTTGVSGVVSAANSLVGSAPTDHVSSGGLKVLNNGYVVMSPFWGGGTGAATFGSNASGVSGAVSSANSLVGAGPGDFIGFTGWNFLSSGIPLVTSAALFQTQVATGGGSGNSLADLGPFGIPSPALVPGQITALSNGDYVVMSPWFNGEKGAATLGSGTTGISGVVSASNSLVGTVPHGYFGSDVREGTGSTRFVASGFTELSVGPSNVILFVNTAPPSITAAFSPASIAVGTASTLTFTISNTSVLAATGIGFSTLLPTGTILSTPTGASNTCGGTLTAIAGTSSIALSGASIAASSSCTTTVSVNGTFTGSFIVSTTAVTSNFGTGATATANLSVGAGIVVTTSPAGLSFTVDNVTYNSAQTFQWAPGSTHSISTTSPQNGPPGTRFAFSTWSDGGALSHIVTAPAGNRTFVANFDTQFQLTTASFPDTGGAVSPATGFFTAGNIVNVVATPAACFRFSGWSGPVTSPNNPGTTVLMNAPLSITAAFAALQNCGGHFRPTLTLIQNPLTGGTITANPPPDLNSSYEVGTIVQITAKTNPGFMFLGFTGDLTGTNNPQSLTVLNNKVVTANWAQIPTTPHLIDFGVQKGNALPPPQSIPITGGLVGVYSLAGGDWLIASRGTTGNSIDGESINLGPSLQLSLNAGVTNSLDEGVYTAYVVTGTLQSPEVLVARLLIDNIQVNQIADSAGYRPSLISADGLFTVSGLNLSNKTLSASTTLLDNLGGAKVAITDAAGVTSSALLTFVSPDQINLVTPRGLRSGPALVRVTNFAGIQGSVGVLIGNVAPGLYTADSTGRGPVAATVLKIAADGTRTNSLAADCQTTPGKCVAAPIDLGGPDDSVYLSVFGTGLRGRTSLDNVLVTVGGLAVTPLYVGPQSQYPGLDQINFQLPQSLTGRGEVDIVVTIDGQQANITRLSVK